MTSKAQSAALSAIKQKITSLEKRIGDGYPYELAPLETWVLEAVEEIGILVAEHSLDEKLIQTSKQRLLDRLYDRAGKLKDHLWQAAFAKRHKLA